MCINYYYFYYAIAQHCSMVLWLGLAIFIMVFYIVFMPLLAPMFSALMDSSISMLSGVRSESEKGVVNSRLSDFHVCWVRVGANLLSRN